MTLPISGPISFNSINVELGVAGATQASLNQATYRTLAGVPSGVISLSNFYGKANEFTFSITSNQTNANLRTLAIAAGWNQTTKLVATINSGIYVSSNSTGTAALTVNGSFPNGVQLVNNGLIIGMGGAGGTGQGGTTGTTGGSAGLAGGGALLVSSALSITNNGTVGGGGGGGGGGFIEVYTIIESGSFTAGGGGGGGGRSSAAANSAGGGITAANTNGAVGQAGTVSSAGAGGAGGTAEGVSAYSGATGGAWGSSGDSLSNRFAPGAGGYAVSGNSNVTWVATGTRLGSLI